jgi:AcrR family transcriptional regulator
MRSYRIDRYRGTVATARETPDRRRQEVLDALLRITVREGLDAVSVRTVAAEAGCSMGFVQRQFHTKDAMLHAAFEHSLRLVATRLEQHVAQVQPGTPGRTFLRRIAEELLEVGDPYGDEAKVWIAFLARAVVSPGLAAALRRNYEAGHELIASVLRLSQQHGEAPAGLDPDRVATALLALVDGLTAHILIGRCDLGTAQQVIADYLEASFRSGSEPPRLQDEGDIDDHRSNDHPDRRGGGAESPARSA